MTIGERIKSLRKKNDLTQEKLADYLCVSYQAVSKWECGLSNPDLSLIGPLTKLLHVSADELIGLKSDNGDTLKEEFEKRHRDTWRTGDLAERRKIAEEAMAEFPGDMKYLDWLAWCEAMGSFDIEDEDEYIAEQEKAIKHFACVVENADNERIKASSLQGIVQYLCIRGRHDEARKYAEMYPENYSVTKDDVTLYCLKGDEKVIYKQKMLDRMMTDFLNLIGTDSILACETQEKILAAMIPDGNYFYYHAFLAYSNRMKAGHLVRAERYDKAIAALRSSLKHSVLYDEFIEGKSMYRFTSPFFDRAEYCTDDICRTGFTTQREDFYEAVKHSPFDRLAEMKEFKELM